MLSIEAHELRKERRGSSLPILAAAILVVDVVVVVVVVLSVLVVLSVQLFIFIYLESSKIRGGLPVLFSIHRASSAAPRSP